MLAGDFPCVWDFGEEVGTDFPGTCIVEEGSVTGIGEYPFGRVQKAVEWKVFFPSAIEGSRAG